MKNIYEDGTMPEQPDIHQVKRQGSSPPTRPRKQVTPTPMQIEKQRQQSMQMPPYGAPYPAYMVGVDQNGQPVYAQNMPVYPQNVPGYTYMPVQMMPPQGVQMMPTQGVQIMNQGVPMMTQPIMGQPMPQQPMSPVPAEQSAGGAAADPGTRVLYQSPDFDLNDPQGQSTEVGATFAKSNHPNDNDSAEIYQEDIELEEVSLKDSSSPKVVYKPRITYEENVEVDEIDFDTFGYSETGESQKAEKENTTQDNEKKPLSKGEIIRRVVLAVAIVAIVISAGMLLNEWRLAKQNDDIEDKASDLIIDDATTNKDDKAKEEEVPLTPEQQWAKIKQEYPNVIFPSNIQLKYAKLYAENTDFVGYLTAKGVGLNLPVVQTDNDEKYLKKNFYGQSTKYGCPFVTHLNSIDPLDMNTVIFGHHMNNNTIFGTLDAYKKIDGFKKAPVITFNTLYKDYSWKVIAAFITNAYAKDDNGYLFQYYFTSLSSQERFSAYLNELSQRSLYDTGVDVLPTDKLLTLSTCSHEFTDARFVVVARLVRDGETTDVDTSKAVVNSSPRYPQAYYNAKKIKNNPYKNASQWQVG